MTAVFFGEVATRWLANGQPAAMIEKTKNQGRVRVAVTCQAIKALAGLRPSFGARRAEKGLALGVMNGLVARFAPLWCAKSSPCTLSEHGDQGLDWKHRKPVAQDSRQFLAPGSVWDKRFP
jgi:hypothetical protein